MSKITERVDPFSGYLTIVQRDIHLPGNGGLDLDIVRTYNSAIWGRRDTSFPGLVAYNESSPLGIGWSLHMGIVRNPYGTGSSNRFLPDNPVVEMPDGSQHKLFVDKNDSTRFISRDYWIYKNIASGKWELKLTDGTKYIFEFNSSVGYTTINGVQIAQITSIEHPNGVSKITIVYKSTINNSYRYIDKIQDSTGRWIYFTYNTSSHRLTQISGADITYNYYYTTIDSMNFLTEAKPPVGDSWYYNYDVSDYELSQVTYPYGGTINYTYSDIWFDTGQVNVQFRVISQRTTDGRGINGGTWSYSYSSGGGSGDVTTVNAPDGFQEIYTHNGWGNSGNGNVWKIGLLTNKTLKKSGSTIYSESLSWTNSASVSLDDISNADWNGTGGSIYDSEIYVPLLSSRSFSRDGQTYTTNYSNYDSYGNPGTISESGNSSRTTSISYWYNTSKNIVHDKPSSEAVSGSFSGSYTTSYSYDSNGNTTQINKYGVVTDFGYFSNGNLDWERDANSKTTSYGWDKGVINRITTPEYTINRSINTNGTIASEANGRGYTTNFNYDGNLRLTQISPPVGNSINFSYPSDNSYRKKTRGGFETYYYHDGFGRPTGTSNSKGVTTGITYNAYGIKTSSTSNINDNIYYDDFERTKQIVHKDGQTINYSYSGSNVTMTNETGGQTNLTYNAFGDPDEKFLTAVNDPAGATASYGRNMLGSLTSISYGGISRSFTYSYPQNFLTGETHPETGNITYGRDNVGNMTSRTDSTGTRNYSYDGVNRLTSISYGSDTVNFGYDGANNRTSMNNPSASISYSYDAANRLTQKSATIAGRAYITNYGYDGNDNITSIIYPSGLNVSYGYNSYNEVTSVTGFGGSVTSINYNLAGQPTSFTFSSGKTINISYNSRYFTTRITSAGAIDVGYAYDQRGNTATITNYLDSSKNQSFNHDALDRLTGFNGVWGTGSFSYDTVGNRLSKNIAGINTTYSYSSNRLSSAAGGEPATYVYYGNGNLQQMQEAGVAYTLIFDGFSNMTEFLADGSPLAQFQYDGDGIRVKKITQNGTIIYHYNQDGKVISETDEYGNLMANYIYVNGKLIAKLDTDPDGDGILDDGDGNGIIGNITCTGGNTINCDDNCMNSYNPDQSDSDGDGTGDVCDLCSSDPNKIDPGICGCGTPDTDTDGDGTPDCNDQCVNDPNKVEPGICGCGTPDTDTDGDGTPDCNDQCINDPNKIDPGICGCGIPDTDTDGDGTPDCNDQCMNDPNKVDPGICGCGMPDTDTDGDGTPDCNDQCVNDPGKIDLGICGCGVPDTDANGDGTPDCFDLHTMRVSISSAGAQGDNNSYNPSISSNGRYVAFESNAINLVTGDTNGFFDVFVHDRSTVTTTLISVDSNGNQGNDHSFAPSISADGRFIAFESDATNLVAGGTNGFSHVFVHDRDVDEDGIFDELGYIATFIVSIDSLGNMGNNDSFSPSISADGTYVTFMSSANNLVTGDTNGSRDIFVHNIMLGLTSRISVDSNGTQANNNSFDPEISGDGRYVSFESSSTNLVAGDPNGLSDIFVHDRDADEDGIFDELGAISTVVVSIDSSGIHGDDNSFSSSISSNGRYIAFESNATNLVTGDTNGFRDIFVHDRDLDNDGVFDETGAVDTIIVSIDSIGTQGDNMSFSPSISADGNNVAFVSLATNLVTGDTNGFRDIFVHNLSIGNTNRISVNSDGNEGNHNSLTPSINENGWHIAFRSDASNLVVNDTNAARDIFVHSFIYDVDDDGILDDGNWSGTLGDHTCTGGNTTSCDDNCRNSLNPGQEDVDGDGIGDACDSCSSASNCYELISIKTGTGSGTVSSEPAGIDCGLDCSETYEENTVITLSALPDAGSSFIGWTGDCASGGGESAQYQSSDGSSLASITMDYGTHATSTPTILNSTFNLLPFLELSGETMNAASSYGSTDTCEITMDADKNVTATFDACVNDPARILRTLVGYPSIQTAYNAAIEGDVIQSHYARFIGDLNVDLPKTVSFQGGYDCDYMSVIGYSVVKGQLTVSDGSVTIENIEIEK